MRRYKKTTRSYATYLNCVSCGKEYRPDEIDYTCPDCGPWAGTLEICYDYSAVKRQLTRESLRKNRDFSHWRYLPILPVNNPDFIPNLRVGWTPLYRSAMIERELGVGSIWIKDDGQNPSASYKDRASSVAVVRALEKGVQTVTAASTGNAAASWALMTALTDLEAVIFVPERSPKAKLAQLALYGATVLQVKGSYDQAFDLCCQAAEKWGWYNRSTGINPYLGEGKKTGALELCEQLNWQPPDYLFVSVGDGCIFQGVWKGFRDLYRLGLIDRLPRMIGVQAQGSAPLVTAWETGSDRAESIIPRTIADSISVGSPRDQIKALKAVRESDGQFISVSDQEILAAIRGLARKVGVMAEPAGAAAFAGMMKIANQCKFKTSDSIAVIVTGHGLKDIESVMHAAPRQSLLVENDLQDVADCLSRETRQFP
ncbi:MAG: threonine synthase [Candidatus Cloacimonetes bacterium 4572_55]|nr:MAG: threonine synthase [Candidatus Cloacimonetes bacterium 4572_55]